MFERSFILNDNISSRGVWEGSKCGSRISNFNFFIVFHSLSYLVFEI